jgi:hypothetical protein
VLLLSGRHAYGLATDPGFPAALQFAPEETADPARGAVDRRKEVGIVFLNGDPTARHEFGLDVAERVDPSVGAEPDCHLSYSAAIAAKRKPQTSFDVSLDSCGKIDVGRAHRNSHCCSSCWKSL